MLYISILALSVCCGLLAWNQYRLYKRIESFLDLVQTLPLEKSLDKAVQASDSFVPCTDAMTVNYIIRLEERIDSLECFTLKSLQHE